MEPPPPDRQAFTELDPVVTLSSYRFELEGESLGTHRWRGRPHPAPPGQTVLELLVDVPAGEPNVKPSLDQIRAGFVLAPPEPTPADAAREEPAAAEDEAVFEPVLIGLPGGVPETLEVVVVLDPFVAQGRRHTYRPPAGYRRVRARIQVTSGNGSLVSAAGQSTGAAVRWLGPREGTWVRVRGNQGGCGYVISARYLR